MCIVYGMCIYLGYISYMCIFKSVIHSPCSRDVIYSNMTFGIMYLLLFLKQLQ